MDVQMTEQDQDHEAAKVYTDDRCSVLEADVTSIAEEAFLAGAQHGRKAERQRILGKLREEPMVSHRVLELFEEKLK